MGSTTELLNWSQKVGNTVSKNLELLDLLPDSETKSFWLKGKKKWEGEKEKTGQIEEGETF